MPPIDPGRNWLQRLVATRAPRAQCTVLGSRKPWPVPSISGCSAGRDIPPKRPMQANRYWPGAPPKSDTNVPPMKPRLTHIHETTRCACAQGESTRTKELAGGELPSGVLWISSNSAAVAADGKANGKKVWVAAMIQLRCGAIAADNAGGPVVLVMPARKICPFSVRNAGPPLSPSAVVTPVELALSTRFRPCTLLTF